MTAQFLVISPWPPGHLVCNLVIDPNQHLKYGGKAKAHLMMMMIKLFKLHYRDKYFKL